MKIGNKMVHGWQEREPILRLTTSNIKKNEDTSKNCL